MKKILFLVMLVVLGNSFAAFSQNSKSGSVSNVMTTSEKKEVERVLQKELQFIMNGIIGSELSETAKIIDNEVFGSQVNINSDVKNRITQKFSQKYISTALDNINVKVDIKEVKNVSNNEVQVSYDVKIKDISKISLENKKEMEEKVLKKLGYKNLDEINKILMSTASDAKKEQIYEAVLQESLNLVEEKLKNIKTEVFLIKDATTVLVKRNGIWTIEGLNN
ncbi:hypothetical protein [Leptotrichia alba]|uniref:DUF4878 domain-containing protein n=1 Tax=Leptotrichia alba TaxID=3239304 RepID=A0AB39V4N6_9FUSO